MASHLAFLKHPLAREITLILLIKLALIMGIRSLWFSTPDTVTGHTQPVAQHLLGTSSAPPEKPKDDL
ncbi:MULTISPECIES: cytochrome oxidase putative small subunit CydP [unclassified Pseudomonas]|uniref:cytochrome oxidase putative small subunit CydP n=1 Tax=unclassified Pseudomonas TaxID=196821 RepID=UPI000BD41DB9|nr:MULTISPECIES: cytochrome oxidase putative small subunit CydP [unclassified Pseudomonas]PVZ15300.1 hypothetical protein F474_02075 [Pseudomonas sp. URIL14HWK12:I12]PVZ24674.1 hypothetical protein F470_01730 [Pseudomonas sp. URIL14HWK12:I10]PVZ34519.1 hypothetical protein F472_02075 [Pseudomonas sp. URIL14HWK12:I11]SNZ08533.1 hypothetical protein SAMN05660463_01063 [Pseudomonas sp. URIL14HWK12:I9]